MTTEKSECPFTIIIKNAFRKKQRKKHYNKHYCKAPFNDMRYNNVYSVCDV